MATAKKPTPKKTVAKKAASKATTKSAVKKAVTKKPVAAKTTKKSGGKKKHIVRRILDFKIKGWVSRKTIVIGGVTAILLVGGFAGYAIWQNMSANAGGTCTLGRSGKSKSTGSFSTKSDVQKYNTCKANAAAQARAEAEAKARAAAAAKTKVTAKSTPTPTKTTSKSTPTTSTSKSTAPAPVKTQPTTPKGWTKVGAIATGNLGIQADGYLCKSGQSNRYKVKGQARITSGSLNYDVKASLSGKLYAVGSAIRSAGQTSETPYSSSSDNSDSTTVGVALISDSFTAVTATTSVKISSLSTCS